MISTATIVTMVVVIIAGIVIPTALLLIMKKKTGGKLVPVWVGCAVMFVFALLLEPMLHRAVLASSVGATIFNNIWLYGLYGALAAATFEEVGRFLAMKFVLKKYHGEQGNALMYGVGHGGFECLYLLVLGTISNLAIALVVSAGQRDSLTMGLSGNMLEQANAQIEGVLALTSGALLIGILERLLAIAAQISMSVMMWQAAAKGNGKYFLMAFAAHFIMDFAIVVVNHYFGIVAAELACLVFSAVMVTIAVKIYKKEKAVN